MTLQLLHSEFPYTVNEENLIFFFISVEEVQVSRITIRGTLHNTHDSASPIIISFCGPLGGQWAGGGVGVLG
jgi:hypothetical protein